MLDGMPTVRVKAEPMESEQGVREWTECLMQCYSLILGFVRDRFFYRIVLFGTAGTSLASPAEA